MPVFAASALRPFPVRAASSSASVVRMPSDLSLEAEKAVMPSISEIGYVMLLDMKKGALGELAEPRRPGNDFAHLVGSDLVSAKPEEFACDALNFPHAKSQPHQPGADRHQAAP